MNRWDSGARHGRFGGDNAPNSANVAMAQGLCHDGSMVKRSSRLAKREALRAIEEAIGSALGKNPPASALGAGARNARIEKPLRRPKKKRVS